MAHTGSGGLKGKVRKLIPKKAFETALPAYHLIRGHAIAAKNFYPGRKLKVIGVTGTNGKTTTVTFIDSILRAANKKTAAYTTVYHRVGDEVVPVTDYTYTINPTDVYKLYKRARAEKVDFFVQEVTSQALHQHRIVGVKYSAAVFTNLTYEHMDYHKTMAAYARAKGMLFKGKPDVIVVNIDDEWGRNYFSKFPAGRRKLLYGKSDAGNANLSEIRLSDKGGKAQLHVDYQTISLDVRIVGEHNIYNAAGAALACFAMGIPIKAIEQGVRNVSAVEGRMSPIKMGQNFGVFTDYAHTPDGIEQSLKSLREITNGKVILVQSVFDGRDPNKWPLLGEAAAKYADLIIVTDEEAYKRPRADMRSAIISGIRKQNGSDKYLEIEDRETAVMEAVSRAKPGDSVLIIPQGHLSGREFYGFTTPGSDAELAKNALKRLGYK